MYLFVCFYIHVSVVFVLLLCYNPVEVVSWQLTKVLPKRKPKHIKNIWSLFLLFKFVLLQNGVNRSSLTLKAAEKV